MVASSQCKYCGDTITYERSLELESLMGAMSNFKPTICPKCKHIPDQEQAAKKRAERAFWWQSTCPPLYQQTDLNHPDMPGKSVVQSILEWPYGSRGLVICGKNRTCKTRLAWLLLRRLYVEENRTVRGLSANQFAQECAESHHAAAEIASDWMEELFRVDVLFIDDLAKFKLTERVEADLFGVIETRTSRLKPCIFTTNFGKGTLLAAMSSSRGPAIVERIREFCKPIVIQ